MFRLTIVVALLTHSTWTAHITNTPSLADRIDKLYEKLESLTISPIENKSEEYLLSPEDKLYTKLDRLNSLSLDTDSRLEWIDEEEEILSAFESWGGIDSIQMSGVIRDLQRLKDMEDSRNEKGDGEYSDAEWNDEDMQDMGEGDYAMDSNDDYELMDNSDITATSKPIIPGVTPSAFTRPDASNRVVFSSADHIAATNERPRILDNTLLTPIEQDSYRRAVYRHISAMSKLKTCLNPQPRWYSVRKLAPAADTLYVPPAVQLHRCAKDTGCCLNESEICAPIDGKYVIIPFFLNKVGTRTLPLARILFFNHTQCGCVSKSSLNTSITKLQQHEQPAKEVTEREEIKEEKKEDDRRFDWRTQTEEPRLEKDEEPTVATSLRRCTCPTLFMARVSDIGDCTCKCDWPEILRRRECLSLSRGKEHFGLKDRVCIDDGHCTTPFCDYGVFDNKYGRCPMKRYRRVRYHTRPRQHTDISN